nr:hypothetical protein [Lactococcus petauri]
MSYMKNDDYDKNAYPNIITALSDKLFIRSYVTNIH